MPKIILVEDNRILKIAQERMLARAGYSVIYAGDGEEALRLAMPEQPDLILLDMMLPKLSGREVLRRLKSDPATAHIPVIVVTSLSQKNEEKLKEAGAAAFFEKNELLDNPEPLLQSIERVLRRAKQAIPAASGAERPAPTVEDHA